MEHLHTYHDGSVLYRISARALCHIPIWKGNRIIDLEHVQRLRESVADIRRLDSGYRIVSYEEEEKGELVKRSYVVDGQHRIRILRDVLTAAGPELDFVVTVTEREMDSEAEVIQYFQEINRVRPMEYAEDPQLLVHPYLQAFVEAYRQPARPVRSGSTRRPYLSLDRFREVLVANVAELRQWQPADFVAMTQRENQRLLMELDAHPMAGAQESMRRKTLDLGFALAHDPQMEWLRTALRQR